MYVIVKSTRWWSETTETILNFEENSRHTHIDKVLHTEKIHNNYTTATKDTSTQ